MRPASSFLFIQLSNARFDKAKLYSVFYLQKAGNMLKYHSSLTHSKRKKRYNR